jgi:ribonuclease HIII
VPPLTSYTCKLAPDQIAQLKRDLHSRGFEFKEVPYAHFGATDGKLSIAVYQSGKLVVQGKGTQEFVEFYLEPELLKEARHGYEHVLDPEMLVPRIGVDESGKGDFFGPLVVAGVFVGGDAVLQLKDAGIRDSKQISSDKRIAELAKTIRKTAGVVTTVVPIGNEAYNRLHAKMANVNSILGWGHARVIENLLATSAAKDCKRAISDQFGNKRIVQQALMERGKKIELIQRHKAESDIAVAAASIIARDEFVARLHRLSKKYGVELPKGASAAVEEAGRELVKKHGAEILSKVAKTHFRTTQKILHPRL